MLCFYYFVEAVRADYRVSRRVRHSARAVATSEGANALIVRASSGHYQGIIKASGHLMSEIVASDE